MQIYINGTGCISPQETAQGGPLLATPREYEQVRLATVDPDYKQWIDVKQIRRMSRVTPWLSPFCRQVPEIHVTRTSRDWPGGTTPVGAYR